MTDGSREGSTPGAALALRSISKTFAGVRALKDVSVDVASGRVTALLGQNGSGKSTLVKILAGFHAPDTGGSATVHGRELPLPATAADARRLGLRFVHQELALVDQLTVADNIALAQGFAAGRATSAIVPRAHREQARRTLANLGVQVDPDARIGSLSSTERMLVAIARAFGHDEDPSGLIVVLDEPTAYLPAGAVDRVLGLLQAATDRGASAVYVTHRLDEVLRIADDLIVLRDGELVANQPVSGLDARGLAEAITGGEIAIAERAGSAVGDEVVFAAERLSGPRVTGVSFALHRGEILGVAGLQGCGRSELVRMVSGVQPPVAGAMTLGGAAYAPRDPHAALRRGVGYVPAERRHHGIVGRLTLRANITLGDMRPYWRAGHLDGGAERTDVERLMAQFDIRPPRPDQLIARFSGGNQQKAVLAKLMRLQPTLLAVDEPTQGVDVGGKGEIARLLREFTANGGAVLLGGSDFAEISDLCHRVLVLDRGRPLGIFDGGTIDESRLALLAADDYRLAST